VNTNEKARRGDTGPQSNKQNPSIAEKPPARFEPGRTPAEQETVLAWNNQEPEAVCFTSDPRVYRTLVAKGYQADAPGDYDGPGARFVIPDKRDVRLTKRIAAESEARNG
jgi:hypothetical protein